MLNLKDYVENRNKVIKDYNKGKHNNSTYYKGYMFDSSTQKLIINKWYKQKEYNYDDKQKDYRIERPTKVKLLSSKHEFQDLPEENKEIIGMILEDNQDFYSKNNRGTVDDTYYMECYDKWKIEHLSNANN